MMRRGSSLFLAMAAVLLSSFALAGCGSDEDEPAAICSDVDALETSVKGITSVEVDQYVMPTLKENLVEVQNDLVAVRQSAKDEYATELDALEAASDSIKTSVQAATDSPSAATVSAVVTAVKALGASLTALDDAVKSTC